MRKFETRAMFVVLIVLCLLPLSQTWGQRKIAMSLEGQLASAIFDLEKKMEADPDIGDRKIRLGRFTGPNLPDSSFDLEFENQIKQRMSRHLTDKSDLVLNGTYRYLESESNDNRGLMVIQIEMEISRRFRKLQVVRREINLSTDIARITGTTVVLPDVGGVEKRNKAVEKSVNRPSFALKNGFMVTTKKKCNYAVAILKKKGGKGPAKFVTPRNELGFAFVDLDVTDTFSIMVYSFDSENDAIANVSIDGLNVANTFCVDTNKPKGYLIKRTKDLSTPSTAKIPGWIKTTKSSEGNVFEFVVNKLGQGAATEMKSRHRIGVIHVDFFEAVPESEKAKLRGRGFGEVGKGRPLNVNYKLVKMVKRDTPTAQISIRYKNQR